MLDSLVRVSRRDGGAADLLDREMRIATEHCSLYESSHVPRVKTKFSNRTEALQNEAVHPVSAWVNVKIVLPVPIGLGLMLFDKVIPMSGLESLLN